MASRFKPLIKAFGFWDGFSFYVHLLFKKHGSFRSSKYQSTITIRPKTTDKYTFTQVFVHDQYNIKLPIEPKTIIDAGANIGLAAIYFAQRYPQSKVVAIEPSKENFDIVLKTIAGNPRIKAFCVGVWNKDVHLTIINPSGPKSSFMVAESSQENPEAIPARSIESIMRAEKWDTIDLLKLDIEGSEKEVFELNYEYWLPRTKVIYLEMHDQMKKGCSKAVFATISKYNFNFRMFDENLIFINEDLVEMP